MALRISGKHWHYRIKSLGHEYTGNTGVAAIRPEQTEPSDKTNALYVKRLGWFTGKALKNYQKALDVEAQAKSLVLTGRCWELKLRPKLFSEAAREFLAWCDGEYTEHPETARKYHTMFSGLTEYFGRRPVHGITPGELEDFKTYRRTCPECRGTRTTSAGPCGVCGGTGMGVRDITIRHDLYALSKFFKWCKQHNWCRENPVREIDIPSDADATREHVLTAEEERLYFSTCLLKGYQDLHDIGRLMILQGPRPEDLFEAEWQFVDLEAGTLQIPKGKSKAAKRTLHLVPEAKSILARRLMTQQAEAEKEKRRPSPWVFPSPRKEGDPLSRLYNSHNKVLDMSGLNFVPYDLRHTWATRMAAAGMPLPLIAAILGHANLRTIMRYVHIKDPDCRKAMQEYGVSAHPALTTAVDEKGTKPPISETNVLKA